MNVALWQLLKSLRSVAVSRSIEFFWPVSQQRCADPKILDPRQSADGDHRSASAARCFLGSAVSPRVRDLVKYKSLR